MSLGWQTESTLLPSKSKPIHVNSDSIISLKNLVNNEKSRLMNASSIICSTNNKKRKLNIENKYNYNANQHKSDKKEVATARELNSNMNNERNLKLKDSTDMLTKKSKIYDDLMKQSTSGTKINNELFLINFKEKGKKDQTDNIDAKEVIPLKKISAGSGTSLNTVNYIDNDTQKVNLDPWQWSNGENQLFKSNRTPYLELESNGNPNNYSEETLTHLERKKLFEQYTENASIGLDRQDEEGGNGRDSYSNVKSTTSSGDARIETQWERVRRQNEVIRNMTVDQVQVNATNTNSNTNNNVAENGTCAHTTDVVSANKADRIAMLLKRKELKKQKLQEKQL